MRANSRANGKGVTGAPNLAETELSRIVNRSLEAKCFLSPTAVAPPLMRSPEPCSVKKPAGSGLTYLIGRRQLHQAGCRPPPKRGALQTSWSQPGAHR